MIPQLGYLLDRLFILDCSLCIFNCALAIILLTITEILGLEHLCFVMFLPNYVHICNRLLNISIVICRYVFVLHSGVVESGGRRRVFQSCVLCFTFLTPLLLTVPDIYYRDNVYNYLSTCVRFFALLALKFLALELSTPNMLENQSYSANALEYIALN